MEMRPPTDVCHQSHSPARDWPGTVRQTALWNYCGGLEGNDYIIITSLCIIQYNNHYISLCKLRLAYNP